MSKALKSIIRRVKLEDKYLITPPLDRWILKNQDYILSEENAELLKVLVTKQGRDRTKSFSGSAAGACMRAQIFGYMGVPPRPIADTTLLQVFRNGTWIHLRWQMMLMEAGLLDEIEVGLPFPNDYRLKGSMDGIGTHPTRGEFMFELKGWGAFRDEPKHDHLLQIHRYFLGSGLELCSLIYEHKTSQNWKEFVVKLDPKISDEVEEELVYLNEFVDDSELPPILHACSSRTGSQYKGCPYRDDCLSIGDWDEAELVIQGVDLDEYEDVGVGDGEEDDD